MEQFLAAPARADQPVSFAGHSLRAHEAAENGDLKVVAEAVRWLDQA
jgi:hypothetical protein